MVAVTGVPGTDDLLLRLCRWRCLEDERCRGDLDANLRSPPVASIGALEVAPSNPNILYAGTGESDIRSDLSSGDGVYKSTDGGATWKNIGLRDSRQISRIVIDPRNPDVVYVGVLGHAYGPNDERGVYKSTDGGNTWTRVLNKGPRLAFLTWQWLRRTHHPVRGDMECAPPAVEHLCSTRRPGQRTLSLERQRRELGATQWARVTRRRLGPRWCGRVAGRQARVLANRSGEEVGPLSLQ